MEEIWKDVVGYEGLYQVSNLGRVKSVAYMRKLGNHSYWCSEKILSLTNGKGGYLRIKFTKNGLNFFAQVHRLVAEAFIPNPNNYPQINHKDENKQNNVVSNLEWCTAKYNNNYGTKIQRARVKQRGRTGGGKRNYKPVLQMDLNGNIINEYKSMAEAQKMTNTHINGIVACCKGRRNKAGGYKWAYK